MTFTVYSKQGCPYCVKVIRALQLSEQKYVELKLDRDFTRPEFIGKFGRTTFPRVLLNNETLIGGCTETVKYLRENNLV
jgi:glutaredoxin